MNEWSVRDVANSDGNIVIAASERTENRLLAKAAQKLLHEGGIRKPTNYIKDPEQVKHQYELEERLLDIEAEKGEDG